MRPSARIAIGSALMAASAAAAPLLHDAGEVTFAGSRFYWAEFPESRIGEIYRPEDPNTPGLSWPAELDNPANAWTRVWIERLDAEMRRQAPERFRGIPRPKSFITGNPTPNAMVYGGIACFKLGSTPVVGTEFALRVSRGETSVGFDSLAPRKDCREIAPDSAESRELIKHFNSFDPGCQISASDLRWRAVGARCPGMSAPTAEGYAQLILAVQSNWIRVHQGVFTEFAARRGPVLGERAAISLLAHELAHYYRAHSVRERDYGFFYHYADAEKSAHTRPADSDARLQKTLTEKTSAYPLPRLPGPEGGFSPELNAWLATVFVRYMISPYCSSDDADCDDRCIEWVKLSDRSLTQIAADPELAKEYFNQATSCLRSLEIKRDSLTDPRPTQSSVQENGWILSDLVTSSFLAQTLMVPPNAVKPSSYYAYSYFKEVDKALASRFTEEREFWTELQRERLGHFTLEQEADDLALEILNRVKIPLHGLLDVYSVFVNEQAKNHAGDEFFRFNGVSLAECRKLFDPSTPLPEWFPFGTLQDDSDESHRGGHHSPCYRAYNLRRELLVHRYALPPDRPPPGGSPTTKEWEAAVEWSKSAHYQLHDPFEAKTPPKGTR